MSHTQSRGKKSLFRGACGYQLIGANGIPKTDYKIVPNGFTDKARARQLIWYFFEQGGLGPPYIILIDNAGFTGTSTSDTAASHPGWTDFQSYSFHGNTTNKSYWPMKQYQDNNVWNQQDPMPFVFTAAGVIQGIAVVAGNAFYPQRPLDAVHDFLISTALFANPLTVAINDILNINYSVSIPLGGI